MKTILSFLLSCSLIFVSATASAQTKKETFKVAGECGMCQKKIEATAKKAGATSASWNTDSKVLSVSYNSKSTSAAKIQEAIAAVGYDTPGFKATDESYSKLHSCCKYERGAAAAASCCDSEKCKGSACMTDGHCKKDQSCCKDSGCDQKACCTKD
ncbi:heavy-metal-associated domain-containing protein [Flaviaesturariibacter amylovorans]|uniref:HMA domain-containing protein n=1 Tax=Flaviaesturariibacter amylovorans TaxID=1084520 RepID=A0ABP8GMN5_9BACT